jgi:Ca2+/H+ antiporter, TMEM165/GDT1 family
LVHVPLNILRLIVGGVLLVFGMQWLRKSILRATGLTAKHDEDAIYEATVATLRTTGDSPGRDRIAFVMAFKGVFLEGLEVVILVLTLGTSAHRVGLSAAVAGIAVVLVALCGVVVAKQLSRVPENLLKMSVGVLLVTYGTFWSGEGLRVRWPGGDTWLLFLAALYALTTWIAVFILQRTLRSTGVRS